MADIVIVSGYFNPLHKGHLEYFEEAKTYSHELWVIVNNDYQVDLKYKDKVFMDEDERVKIISSLKIVDRVFLSIDKDRSVCETLRNIIKSNPNDYFIFFNSGDVKEKCREEETCEELGIASIYGEKNKIQSSSWLTGIKTK